MFIVASYNDPADTALFADAVSSLLITRVQFYPAQKIGSNDFLLAEQMLRGLAHSDERNGEEAIERESDEALRRMEAKIDMMSRLLAQLISQQLDMPKVRELLISRRGVRINHAENFSTPNNQNDHGIVKLQLVDWLPEFVSLPVKVIAQQNDALWLQFDQLPSSLDHAIERYIFRLHRRSLRQQHT